MFRTFCNFVESPPIFIEGADVAKLGIFLSDYVPDLSGFDRNELISQLGWQAVYLVI